METHDQISILSEILAELKSQRNQTRTWLNVEQVSDYLGLEPGTIYQYTRKGKIPHKKIPGGRTLLFSREEIDDWIDNEANVVEIDSKIKDGTNGEEIDNCVNNGANGEEIDNKIKKGTNGEEIESEAKMVADDIWDNTVGFNN